MNQIILNSLEDKETLQFIFNLKGGVPLSEMVVQQFAENIRDFTIGLGFKDVKVTILEEDRDIKIVPTWGANEN